MENRELINLKVKIDVNKKETLRLEIPKEYQTRDGILKYIKESVKDSVSINDVSFEILD